MKDRVGGALSRLFDAAAAFGYLVFGLPLLILGVGILLPPPFHLVELLLGGIFAVTGGGAILAATQTWRREPSALSGPTMVIAGIVAYAVFAWWAFTGGRWGP